MRMGILGMLNLFNFNRPFLSPDDGTSDEHSALQRKTRRDSLSPDSAAEDDHRFNRKRKQSRRQSTVFTEVILRSN